MWTPPIVFLWRTLFPSGSPACIVVALGVTFFVGLYFEQGAARPGPQTAVITNFAEATPEFSPSRLTSDTEKFHARQHVAAYMAAHAVLFRRDPIVSVEFRAGDGRRVEVF